MGAPQESDGHVANIAPPQDDHQQLSTTAFLLLVCQLLWIGVLILPCALVEVLWKLVPSREKSLRGKVVLVTGAGRGLGKGLALSFANEGCKVAVADVCRVSAEQTTSDIVSSGGEAIAYVANVAKVKEMKELQKSITADLGPVDILVNNAGLIHCEALEDFTDDTVRTVLDVNLTSHFWTVREFLPAMRKRNSGHIVAIASVAAFSGEANGTAYVATKFGIRGFMKTLEVELNSNHNNKIRTTTVYPYFINTSADYMKQWNLRIPAITVEEAVEAILSGVKKEKEELFVPGYMGYFLPSFQALPRYLQGMAMRTFFTKITPLSSSEKKDCLTTIISKEIDK